VGATSYEPEGKRRLSGGERMAVGFFGVRGIGSVYYLAYADGQARFDEMPAMWSTVAFTIALSILVHGLSATPVMNRFGSK
jgi:NhaP-type Na+/H+ or K+/H+ antiporter